MKRKRYDSPTIYTNTRVGPKTYSFGSMAKQTPVLPPRWRFVLLAVALRLLERI